jgi:hypothetical protein
MKILPITIIVGVALSVVQTSSTMSPHQLTAASRKEIAILPVSPSRLLSFEDRIKYQRAIEEVYWRHRIWPKENRSAKPSFDRVIPPAAIEKKVTSYLHNSELLEQEQKPITPEQLQAEMDRMAQQTKQPDVLRELFAALDNDPTVIAECLARPAVAERLTRDLSSHRRVGKSDATAHKPASRSPGVTLALLAERFDGLLGVQKEVAAHPLMLAKTARYRVPAITDTPSSCAANWTATTLTGAPDVRWYHTAVWTGSEMIVWGGYNYNTGWLQNGGKYDPATDSWTPTAIPIICNPTVDCAPSARSSHSAVWTGTEMIIWGGADGSTLFNTGAAYNPGTDIWTATSTTNAPAGRTSQTAVWTGSEMIIWGGDGDHVTFGDGGRYHPDSGTWTATSTTNAPSPRDSHTAVWTGSEMIVWGGQAPSITNTGARYDPSTDTWTATNTINAADRRRYHTAVWAGNVMIVWGGNGDNGLVNTGGKYDPLTDSWAPTSSINAPTGRLYQTALWTGNQMLVWGGSSVTEAVSNTGGAYDASTDTWTATATTNAPVGRLLHTGVWTGTEMIVWGGNISGCCTTDNTGGRYSGQVPLPAAVSRKNHGGTDRDLTLTFGGSPRIECRTGGGSNGDQLVVTFANAVTFDHATVTAGVGNVTLASGSGTDTATIDLTGVTNAQTINVTLFGVTDDCGTRDITVPMSILVGDTTGDGSVNSADISQTKSRSGQSVSSTNFRSDVTADGNLNSADISLVKSKSGTALP